MLQKRIVTCIWTFLNLALTLILNLVQLKATSNIKNRCNELLNWILLYSKFWMVVLWLNYFSNKIILGLAYYSVKLDNVTFMAYYSYFVLFIEIVNIKYVGNLSILVTIVNRTLEMKCFSFNLLLLFYTLYDGVTKIFLHRLNLKQKKRSVIRYR